MAYMPPVPQVVLLRPVWEDQEAPLTENAVTPVSVPNMKYCPLNLMDTHAADVDQQPVRSVQEVPLVEVATFPPAPTATQTPLP